MKLRLAPTPAALLQVGNARIALATWLLARRHDGKILLRLDDADPARVTPERIEALEHDLRWLGLDWDDRFQQSQRLELYQAAADKLKTKGRLYPCFESEEELVAKREHRQRQGKPLLYDRAMLKLTAAQRANAEAGGKRPHWRFLLQGPQAEWGDMVLGRSSVKLTALSDPVLIRADGSYHNTFTSVVDDLDLGVTHLVRGDDHLTHTGIQLDVMAALGARANTIRFAHLPLMTDTVGQKLTKRTGLVTLRSLRADGIEAASLAGMLAALGTDRAPAPAPPAVLAVNYDLSKIGRTPPAFDPKALLAVNRQALAATSFEAAQDRLPPAATPAFWTAIRGDIDLLREARGWWDVVAGSIVPPLLEDEADYLHEALEHLPPEPWDEGTWGAWTGSITQATDRAGETLLMPLRLALTGEDHGPDLRELLPLMGRARVTERLKGAAS